MNVSVLLRLRPSALTDGRLVGQLEFVDTGEQILVRSTEELVDCLRSRVVESLPDASESE